MFSVCLAGALLAFSSCRSSKNVMPQASLAGEWNIVELNGTAVVPDPGQEFPFIGINADNGNVYGNTGCNRIMGTVALNGKPGEIDLSSLGSTRMACPDMKLESNILKALNEVKSFGKLQNGGIGFYSAENALLLVLER